jgi:hypothetical protein
MAQAGCYGPDYTFNGDRLNSNTKKGRCTGTAGYIADAEIAEMLADESCVVSHFVNSSSNIDILKDNAEIINIPKRPASLRPTIKDTAQRHPKSSGGNHAPAPWPKLIL